MLQDLVNLLDKFCVLQFCCTWLSSSIQVLIDMLELGFDVVNIVQDVS